MADKYIPIFTKFAEEDLIEILDYFADKNPEYIEKLAERIDVRLAELKQFPQKGRIVPELEKKSISDYREIIEGHYRIIYHMIDKKVFILSIIDGRRNLEEIIVNKLMRI